MVLESAYHTETNVELVKRIQLYNNCLQWNRVLFVSKTACRTNTDLKHVCWGKCKFWDVTN